MTFYSKFHCKPNFIEWYIFFTLFAFFSAYKSTQFMQILMCCKAFYLQKLQIKPEKLFWDYIKSLEFGNNISYFLSLPALYKNNRRILVEVGIQN